jgi:PAS domain S-box-containing protein
MTASSPQRSVSALETEEGVLIFNTIRDLTARRRTEEDLRRLASIVAWSDDAIIGKTLGGIITSWNAGAERIYGYLAKEAIGKHVSMLVPFDRPDEIPQILKLLERGETVNHFETIRVRKDGEKIQIAVTTSPIRDGTGRIVGASTVSRDISVRKQAEEHAVEMDDELKRSAETNRIRQLELQLKDDFLSHVSHELRSPLTAIYQFGTIIADGLAGETSHEQNEFLRIILRGSCNR